MAILRVTRGLEPGRVCSLELGTTILGRNPKRCDVVLEHFAVSREHARIEVRDDVSFIEDLGSRNGVWVNGQLIETGPDGRRQLNGYDRIAIAAFALLFEDDVSVTDSGRVMPLHAEETVSPDIHSTVDVGCDSSYESLLDDEESGDRSRSEERRVGKECRSRWSPYHYKKNTPLSPLPSPPSPLSIT